MGKYVYYSVLVREWMWPGVNIYALRRRELDGSGINKHHALTAFTARKDSCCSLDRKVCEPCAAVNF
jgi:hypothetical protein